MPATADLEVQGLLCPSPALYFFLFISLWFSLPLTWSPPNICLKVTMWKCSDGLMTWYAAQISVHKPCVDATTRTQAGFVLAVTQWQLKGGTNKNSSRCLNSPPLSSFHLVLSKLCSMLPSSLQPSSLIPKCLHPSTALLFLSSHQIALAMSRPHHQKSSYSSHILSMLAVSLAA